jgi:hypothetical protein
MPAGVGRFVSFHVVEQHFTFGVDKNFTSQSDISLVFLHLLPSNYNEPPSGGSIKFT